MFRSSGLHLSFFNTRFGSPRSNFFLSLTDTRTMKRLRIAVWICAGTAILGVGCRGAETQDYTWAGRRDRSCRQASSIQSRSVAELRTWYAYVTQRAAFPGVTSTYIDEVGNRIVISVADKAALAVILSRFESSEIPCHLVAVTVLGQATLVK